MKSYSRLSDIELIALLKEGDHYAYTEIFERYHKILVLHAFRILNDEDEAGDAVQDVFLKLWQKKDTLVFQKSLSNYLYSSVRNRVLDLISHKKVVSRYAESFNIFWEEGQSLTDDLIRGKELAALIEKEIEKLPEKMRAVFLLNKKEQLSYTDIAQQLNITDKSARQQVYNAVKILKVKINSLLSIFISL